MGAGRAIDRRPKAQSKRRSDLLLLRRYRPNPAVQADSALKTFNRPPVMVMPLIDGMGSTVSSSSCFKASVLKSQTESASAAAPATCGVAIDVPVREA